MTALSFDEELWSAKIAQPNWYVDLMELIKRAEAQYSTDSPELNELYKKTRHFFEQALQEDKVSLATSGPDLDKARLTVDTIVVHHTSHTPGYRLSYMEATQLLNVYARYYINPTIKEERGLKGMAIWSGHFRHGRQTFLCYHWLMRMDGTFERLLDDSQIGWHAGNWDVNRRSIAICLDNDYESDDPDEQILKQLAAHIKTNYPSIKPDNVIGHCEAKSGTVCPGGNFVSVWKNQLLKYLNDA